MQYNFCHRQQGEKGEEDVYRCEARLYIGSLFLRWYFCEISHLKVFQYTCRKKIRG